MRLRRTITFDVGWKMQLERVLQSWRDSTRNLLVSSEYQNRWMMEERMEWVLGVCPELERVPPGIVLDLANRLFLYQDRLFWYVMNFRYLDARIYDYYVPKHKWDELSQEELEPVLYAHQYVENYMGAFRIWFEDEVRRRIPVWIDRVDEVLREASREMLFEF